MDFTDICDERCIKFHVWWTCKKFLDYIYLLCGISCGDNNSRIAGYISTDDVTIVFNYQHSWHLGKILWLFLLTSHYDKCCLVRIIIWNMCLHLLKTVFRRQKEQKNHKRTKKLLMSFFNEKPEILYFQNKDTRCDKYREWPFPFLL